MGRMQKFDYQAAIELSLIDHPEGLSLDELVERSGLKVDRSTLFRHLTTLIESGRAERIGKARASRYRALGSARSGPGMQARHAALQPAAEPVEQQIPNASSYPAPTDTPHTDPSGRPEPEHAVVLVHEAVVKKAVRAIVRDWKRYNRINLEIYLSLLVTPESQDEVAAEVEKALAGLRAEDLPAFGLTRDEFARYVALAASRK